jgi:hypothetical protein
MVNEAPWLAFGWISTHLGTMVKILIFWGLASNYGKYSILG